MQTEAVTGPRPREMEAARGLEKFLIDSSVIGVLVILTKTVFCSRPTQQAKLQRETLR
jgi:hypothetical protein